MNPKRWAYSPGRSSVPAVEVVSQAGAYHGEILILLQHKRLVTCNEMRIVGAEVIKQTFNPETEMWKHLVVYPTADHEAGFVIPPAKNRAYFSLSRITRSKRLGFIERQLLTGLFAGFEFPPQAISNGEPFRSDQQQDYQDKVKGPISALWRRSWWRKRRSSAASFEYNPCRHIPFRLVARQRKAV